MNLSRPLAWALAVLGLVVAALIARCHDHADVVRRDGLRFSDYDTVRRLERIRAIEEAGDYPIREIKDGFPQGSVSHWTRPMDWTIELLDPIGALFVKAQRPREAGAAIAGPVLACLALIVLLFGVRRLAGPGVAVLAGLMYALSYSVVNVSWLGNGDHHNLQHLALAAFLFGSLLLVEGKVVAGFGALSGAALGLAIWVSTESMLLLYPWLVFVVVAAFVDPPDRRFWRHQLAWTGGLLAALVVGHVCEHRDLLAFELDKISTFQLYQVAVWTIFVALLARREHAARKDLAIAAAIALACGLAPLSIPALRGEIDAQRAQFAVVNVWLQNEVTEFRNLLVVRDEFSLAPALERFSFLIFALPLFVLGTARVAILSRRGRTILALLGLATFGLACWEVKLAHLFALVFPLLVVLGARGLFELVRRGRPLPTSRWPGLTWPGLALGAVIAAAVGTTQPTPRSAKPQLVGIEAAYRQIADTLRRLSRNRPAASVVAPWDMSAHLMYHGEQPVVASGYHRNLDGIHDGYRILLSQPGETAALRELLDRRQVRYVVAWFSRAFLANAPATLGRPPLVTPVPGRGLSYSQRCQTTLYWRLMQGPVDGFREVARGQDIERGNREVTPMFRIYEVVR